MSCLFRMFDDESSVAFCSVDDAGIARGGRFRRVNFHKDQALFEGLDRAMFIAAGVIQEGEAAQRRTVQRKLKKGTRNIKNKVIRPVQCLGLAVAPELMESGKRKDINTMLSTLKEDLHGVVTQAFAELGVSGELPAPYSYVITEDVMAAAEESGCVDYFSDIEGQTFLSCDVSKIEDAVRTEYPGSADAVIKALHGTKNQDHLSMISLEPSKKGGLFVTVLSPKGHHLKVEAKQIVEMISDCGQSKRLFAFPQAAEREVIEASFNNRKEGVVIGKFSKGLGQMEVACCVGRDSLMNVVDKSHFYVDPEYLICLWVVLNGIASGEQRYLKLKAKAETFTDFDPFQAGAL